jgi:hypothetical protein
MTGTEVHSIERVAFGKQYDASERFLLASCSTGACSRQQNGDLDVTSSGTSIGAMGAVAATFPFDQCGKLLGKGTLRNETDICIKLAKRSRTTPYQPVDADEMAHPSDILFRPDLMRDRGGASSFGVVLAAEPPAEQAEPEFPGSYRCIDRRVVFDSTTSLRRTSLGILIGAHVDGWRINVQVVPLKYTMR